LRKTWKEERCDGRLGIKKAEESMEEREMWQKPIGVKKAEKDTEGGKVRMKAV
jgi:hypothetical protein